MIKRAAFRGQLLPLLLLAPQLLILAWFFFWPSAQALWQSLHISDAFGGGARFVGADNFTRLWAEPAYLLAMQVSFLFSALTAALAMGMGLIFAILADRVVRGSVLYRTLLIWPYAVAPAVAGALWLFLFHPTIGIAAWLLNERLGLGWDPALNTAHGMALVVFAAAWKQLSYNFVFFLAGLAAVPRSVIEAAAVDGAGPVRHVVTIVLPLLSPTTFFLAVVNIVYAFIDTFGVIHTTTGGGPAGFTTTLVYKVYRDGFVGLDLGASAAQSVVLMLIVVVLTVLQFRFIERKVSYA